MLIVITLIAGCSSSSDNQDNTANSLLGTWLSNCHELLGVESESGGKVYAVSEITVLESKLTDDTTSYDDVNCTIEAFKDPAFAASYIIGNTVITSDGAAAT